jgi:putative transposase
VSKRVSPADRLGAEVDGLFACGRDLAAILEDVACVSVRLLMRTALEAEVDAFLGRARCQRREQDGPAGSRNGWQPPTTVPTTMGTSPCHARSSRH